MGKGFSRKEAKAMGNNAKGNKETIKRKQNLVRQRLAAGRASSPKTNHEDNEEDVQIHKHGR